MWSFLSFLTSMHSLPIPENESCIKCRKEMTLTELRRHVRKCRVDRCVSYR